MYTYTYTQNDFIYSSKMDISDIQQKIIDLNLSSASIQYIDGSGSSPNVVLDIHFSNQLSQSDKDALDAFVSQYTDPSNELVCSYKDVKPPGTNGGTFSSGAWVTRELNTVEGNVSWSTLSNNVINIAPGIYEINVNAPACNVGSHQIKLRNLSDNSYSMGSSAYAANGMMSSSTIYNQFEFQDQTNFDIQHICETTSSNIGFGRATGFNTTEVYTTVYIRKITVE